MTAQTHFLRLILFVTCMCGCSTPPPIASTQQLPTRVWIGAILQAENSSQVSRVSVTLNPSDSTKLQQTDLVLLDGQWQGSFEELQGISSASLEAIAYNATGEPLLRNSTTLMPLAKGSTRAVLLTLASPSQPLAFLNSFPEITSLTASSYQVGPGQSIDLVAVVRDVDSDERLSFQWSGGGTFEQSNSLSTSWVAPAEEGVYQLTFLVKDSHEAEANVTLLIDVKAEYLPVFQHRRRQGKDDDDRDDDERKKNKSKKSKGKAEVLIRFNKAPVVRRLWAKEGNVSPGSTTQLFSIVLDPDGNIVSYRWSDNCGGMFQTPGSQFSHWKAPTKVPKGQRCRIQILVKDNKGATSRGVLHILVGHKTSINISPQFLHTFQSDDKVKRGKNAVFRVTVVDPEGQSLRVRWYGFGRLGKPKVTHSSITTSEVTWKAPRTLGSCYVWAVIWDEKGACTIERFTIRVVP